LKIPNQYNLESFRADFESLAAILKDSWSENQYQSVLYDESFLRSAFKYPGASFDLAPTIYIDGYPAAFVAGFPRTVRLRGHEQRLAYITFWTTSAKFKGRGYGSRVWMEILRRARDSGFDGAVNFCVDGSAANAIVMACGERVSAEVYRVFSIKYLARLLRPALITKTVTSPKVVDQFLRSAAQVPGSVPLVRIWSREEAEWQCLRRTGALCAVREEGSRSGVATGYLVEVIDETPTKALMVEDLLWGDLEAQERLALLQQLLAQGAAAGAQIAVAPLMGYAETDTLRGMGFRQSRRLVHMYLTVWGGVSAPESLSSLYLDVF
jgi:ribosomal protein S18 acetylase RimI-like enzyme